MLWLIATAAPPVSASTDELDPTAPELQLTPSQRAWLDAHPTIKLAAATEHPPALMQTPDGELVGTIPDMIDRLSALIHHPIELLPANDASAAHALALQSGVHGKAAAIRTSRNADRYLFTDPYFASPVVAITRATDEGLITSVQDLPGRRVALPAGHHALADYLAGIDNAQPVFAQTPREQLLLVSNGQADVALGYSTYRYLLHKHYMVDLRIAFETRGERDVRIAVGPAHAPLRAILDKAIDALPPGTMQRLHAKWSAVGRDTVLPLSLTPEETDWLGADHEVRVRIKDWPPYMMAGPRPSGIAVETLRRLSERLGFRLRFITGEIGWPESLADLAGPRAHFDLIPTMKRTPERERRFALTRDYLSAPWVIFTRDDAAIVVDLSQLNGETVAVERGFAMQRKLARGYPEIRLIVRETSLDALEAVATGRAFAYIGNLVNAGHLIRERGLSNLRVAAPTPFDDHAQAMAIRSDWPELASIIDKGLAAMSVDERNTIQRKWLNLDLSPGVPPRTVLLWIGAVAGSGVLGMALIGLWNRTLSREIRLRRQAERELVGVLDDNRRQFRELECIHGIAECARQLADVDATLAASAAIIARAWHGEEDVGACIRFGDKRYLSEGFAQSATALRHDIVIEHSVRGMVEVNFHRPSGRSHAEGKRRFAMDAQVQLLRTIALNLADAIGRKEAESAMHHLAIHDPLTGTLNRGELETRLQQEVARAARYDHALCVLFLDLDHFKRINDEHGHAAGDAALRAFADLLRSRMRESDICGRYGGEEFVMVLPETAAEDGGEIAERLRRAVSKLPIAIDQGRSFFVTVSIGLAAMPAHGTSAEALLSAADAAVYAAKRAGRDRVVVSRRGTNE